MLSRLILISRVISQKYQQNSSITRKYLPAALSFYCTNPQSLFDNISITDKKIQRYLENVRLEYYNLKVAEQINNEGARRMQTLSHLVDLVEKRKAVLVNLSSLDDIKDEKDAEMIALVKEEREVYGQILNELDNEILQEVFEMDESEDYGALMLEVKAGVGGQEAMLFADELFDMYMNFCQFKGWDVELLNVERSDVGGIRHASLMVNGGAAYKSLKHEGGVHRVQRIPTTEKSGRIHTSTVTVAVIPRPDDFDVEIKEKDLKIETKRATGAGGQHVNTTDSAVRIVHLPTGIAVECQTERSQHKNKENALKKLKAIMIQRKLEEQLTSVVSNRKAQVGTSNRNEKIRTYNYNQDRITDHRIDNGTVHNLKGFLEGGSELEQMITRLSIALRRRHLMEIIDNMKDV